MSVRFGLPFQYNSPVNAIFEFIVMPVFFLRTLFRGFFLTLPVVLTGCVSAPISVIDTKLTLLSPIDAQTLPIKNLISYDLYVDGATVHALFAAQTETADKPYIGYLRSSDGGEHWTQPLQIGQHAASALQSAAGNELQIAASGNTLLAIWQVKGEIPGMGPLQALYSMDAGQTWVPGSNPTGSDIDQSHPELIADQQGRFHLMWLDDRDENGYQGARYAASDDAGQHWLNSQTMDDSSCSCCWNRLSADANGDVFALYRDMEPRDMALAESDDAGQSWNKISTVGAFNWQFDGCPHNGGALTGVGGATLHSLVWTGAAQQAGLYYLRSQDHGKTWSQPQTMGGNAQAFHSDIAQVGERHLLAIWDARGADGSNVLVTESLDAGNHWSPAHQISTPGSAATFPRLLATQNGFLAVWYEQQPGQPKRWLSAVFKNNN